MIKILTATVSLKYYDKLKNLQDTQQHRLYISNTSWSLCCVSNAAYNRDKSTRKKGGNPP